jgi:hypothetical protein
MGKAQRWEKRGHGTRENQKLPPLGCRRLEEKHFIVLGPPKFLVRTELCNKRKMRKTSKSTQVCSAHHTGVSSLQK